MCSLIFYEFTVNCVDYIGAKWYADCISSSSTVCCKVFLHFLFLDAIKSINLDAIKSIKLYTYFSEI